MLNSRGFASLLIVFILLLGLGIGIYLVSQRTNFLPKAFQTSETPILSLTKYDASTNTRTSIDVLPEEHFTVNVLIKSPKTAIKSIDAQIIYPKELITFIRVDATSLGAIPASWQEQSADNFGVVKLVADFPGDGFKSDNEDRLLAKIEFAVNTNTGGQIGRIDFAEGDTKLFQEGDGMEIPNIIKRAFELRIGLAAH